MGSECCHVTGSWLFSLQDGWVEVSDGPSSTDSVGIYVRYSDHVAPYSTISDNNNSINLAANWQYWLEGSICMRLAGRLWIAWDGWYLLSREICRGHQIAGGGGVMGGRCWWSGHHQNTPTECLSHNVRCIIATFPLHRGRIVVLTVSELRSVYLLPLWWQCGPSNWDPKESFFYGNKSFLLWGIGSWFMYKSISLQVLYGQPQL